MEASGSTPNRLRRRAEPATRPRRDLRRRRAAEPADGDKAGGGWRALGVVLALALAFACAVMVIAMADIGDTPTCDDVLAGKAALPCR